MSLERFDTQQPGFYSRKDYSPRDAQGYDKRGRKKIRGYSQAQGPSRGFAGLNEFFALQNRATPAFSQPGGLFSAQDMAQQLRREGATATKAWAGPPGQAGGAPASSVSDSSDSIPKGYLVGQVPDLEFKSPVKEATQGATQGATPLTQTMDNLRNVGKQTPEQNRAGLQSMAGEIAARRSFANPSPVSPNPTGPGSILTSKYGTGSSVPAGPGPRKEGLIGGRPASEVMQGLANSQARSGTARPDDKYKAQPTMTAADAARLRRSVAARRTA